ncbi:AbgT family transporter [Ihubacter sp. rT4E-8]|uniref:AbgT family transporter n=1 Tax=unclassified Ihubacter TaxID=2633299 RepID=UPI00137ABA1D
MKQKESRIWNGIEKFGNKLPHPVYIFMILTVVVFIVSALCGNIVFPHPTSGEEQHISNLMSKEGLTWFLQSMVENFVTFSPLGITLVSMLGIGIAEESGLVTAVIKSSISGAPRALVTAIVLFVGIMGSLAGSATFVIIPPLGAMIFRGMGRHPIAGLATGFAGVAAGLSANLLITQTDILLSGITESAAQIYDPSYAVNPTVNWYFMAASTIVLTIVGTIVVDKIIEPRLGEYHAEDGEADNIETAESETLAAVTGEEKSGLKWAGIATLIYVIIIAITIIPKNGLLRGEDGGVIVSPFMSGMVPILTLLFLVAGLAYGIRTKVIKKSADLVNMWGKSMAGLAGFVVLCFFAGQFVKAFSQSNLGLYLSVKGSDFLSSSHLTGVPLIVAFIGITMLINFVIGSASAKWALMAPIFVPMFMGLGFTPEFTQAAFRIADSVTNSISPLEPFMPFIIMTALKYDKKSGLGSIIATMLPLAITFAVTWVLLLLIWYKLQLPLGPGSFIMM